MVAAVLARVGESMGWSANGGGKLNLFTSRLQRTAAKLGRGFTRRVRF
jgi:hypothetical protein